HLDRDGTPLRVAAEVHRAHAALADPGLDPVPADPRGGLGAQLAQGRRSRAVHTDLPPAHEPRLGGRPRGRAPPPSRPYDVTGRPEVLATAGRTRISGSSSLRRGPGPGGGAAGSRGR